MPIYEYQCPECSNIFEEWAKASEMQEIAPCPLCHTPSERIISHTAFVLKGGGWYVTDYGYRKNISEDSAAASHAGASPAIPAAGHSASGSQEGSGSSSGSDAKQGQPAASEGAAPVKEACAAPDKSTSGGKSSTASAPTGAAAPTSAV